MADGLVPRLLSWREVADVLGCGRWRVDKLRKDGELPALRIGREWKFRAADLAVFTGQQTAAGDAGSEGS